MFLTTRKYNFNFSFCRTRWPRDLRREFAGIAGSIPAGVSVSVRGVCDGPIPRPEESHE